MTRELYFRDEAPGSDPRRKLSLSIAIDGQPAELLHADGGWIVVRLPEADGPKLYATSARFYGTWAPLIRRNWLKDWSHAEPCDDLVFSRDDEFFDGDDAAWEERCRLDRPAALRSAIEEDALRVDSAGGFVPGAQRLDLRPDDDRNRFDGTDRWRLPGKEAGAIDVAEEG